jgi:tellurite resistance protein
VALLAVSRIGDHGIAQLYARAVLAIARADGRIELEEGRRLEERIVARTGRPISLDALLLAEPLSPHELVDQLRALLGGPFRGGDVHPGELARLIVIDGVSVVLAKGHVSDAEAAELARFAFALGCTIDDMRRMSQHLVPWLAAVYG